MLALWDTIFRLGDYLWLEHHKPERAITENDMVVIEGMFKDIVVNMKDAPHGTIEQLDVSEVCRKIWIRSPHYVWNRPIRKQVAKIIEKLAKDYFVWIWPYIWQDWGDGPKEVLSFLIYRDHFRFRGSPAPSVFEKLSKILWVHGFEGGPNELRLELQSNRDFQYIIRNLGWVTGELQGTINYLIEKCLSEIGAWERAKNPVTIINRFSQK